MYINNKGFPENQNVNTNFKGEELLIPLKEFIKLHINKIFVGTFIFGLGGLIFKLFDFITLIYLGMIISSVIGYSYLKITKAVTTGLINFLPRSLKNLLLQRSIFDVLMDIWYFPTITEYIKLLFKPVIYKLTPEEATKVLEDFEPGVRRFFLTKGVINLLPSRAMGIFVPENKINEEIKNLSTNIPAISGGHNLFKGIEELDTNTTRSDLKDFHDKINTLTNEEQSMVSLPFEGEKDKLLKSNLKMKVIDYEKEFPITIQDITKKDINKNNTITEECPIANVKKIFANDDYRFYEVDDENGKILLKTKVIESSEKLKNKGINQLRSNFSMSDLKQFTWDRLEEYKYKNTLRAVKIEESHKKISFFELLTKSLKQHILSKIDYEKLSKAFIIFFLTFLIQIIISKRARRWSVSIIQFALYTITSLGAGGTLYFLLKKKSNKNVNSSN